jgi:hypothetical protein
MQESIFAVRNKITSSTEVPLAELMKCVFCVDENKVPEIHDATIFFSAVQLIRHVALRHRPVRQVDGIKVSYGIHSDQYFDLSFTSNETRVNPPSNVSTDISSLPTGYAIQAHRPKSGSKFCAKDPNGNSTLQFAIGAQIAGIAFPLNLKGQWYSGYHDGTQGLFPSETIRLNAPSKTDIVITPKSSLVATARWDHNPKDTSASWLAFSRKEVITHIGFRFEDHWCYSGQNRKGKFGIFPKEFVVVNESLKDEGGDVVRRGGEAQTQKSRSFWQIGKYAEAKQR